MSFFFEPFANGNPFSLCLKRFLTNLRLSPGDVKTRL
jgi:hypothetical protein